MRVPETRKLFGSVTIATTWLALPHCYERKPFSKIHTLHRYQQLLFSRAQTFLL